MEAAARHGDEVFRLATRVPEAAPALAARAGELLPLVARHGDDVLRIEAKLPGVATDLCRVFPHADDLARLARLQPQVLQQTAAYSTHAVNPAASRLLLRMAERQGGAFLKNLSPGQILASGLSLSAVITAAGGFTAFWRYPDQVIPIVKDLLLGLCGPAAQALAWMTFLVGIVIALALAEKLGVLRLLQRSKA